MSATKKASSTKKAAIKKTSKTTVQIDPPDVAGSADDYETFVPAARAIAAKDVRVLRSDPSLAVFNVRIGVDAVVPHLGSLGPKVSRAEAEQIRSLKGLANALAYASRQALGGGRNVPLHDLLKRGSKLRVELLAGADALVAKGIIPAQDVARIRAGQGVMDTANDCVDLAKLFQKYSAKISGRTAVEAKDLKEALAVGTSLQSQLKPTGARETKSSKPMSGASDMRDRLAVLLDRGHDVLFKIGAQIYGRDVLLHVPLLFSRTHIGKKTKAADKTAPSAPVANG